MPGKRFKPQGRMATELTPEIRAQVNAMMLEGATYDEVSQWLADQGHDIHRSVVGRYGKKFFEFHQKAMHFRDQAAALRGKPGESLTIDEVITQAIQQQLMEKLMDGTLDVLEAPKVMGELARLQSAGISREKLKSDLLDKADRAAKSVETIARKGGLSNDTIHVIRKEILGIAE